MGNHDVGRAMASAAKVFFLAMGKAEPSKEQALAALDLAAEPYIGADAEFDDQLYEDTPLRRLVTVAFDATPEEVADRDSTDEETDDAGMLWYAGPITRFRDRYNFC